MTSKKEVTEYARRKARAERGAEQAAEDSKALLRLSERVVVALNRGGAKRREALAKIAKRRSSNIRVHYCPVNAWSDLRKSLIG